MNLTHYGPAPQTPRFAVNRAEALRYLGYDGQEVDAALQERIDRLFAQCEQVSKPGWAYAVFDVLPDEGEGEAGAAAGEGPAGASSPNASPAPAPIRLAGTTLELPGNDIHAHLAGARKVAVLTATAGLANEQALRSLSARNGLDAMIFGAAGSALVETVADDCNAQIIEEARSQGLYPNWRYGPGYGDLPLNLQPAIVRVLSADRRLGISATASNLLIPSKSITAVIGFFDTPQQERHGCADCAFAAFCTLKKKGSPCSR